MRAVTFSICKYKRPSVLRTGMYWPFRILGAALLALAVTPAPCQPDSSRFPAQIPTAERIVVSKNQLRVPQKAQKAIDRAHEDFLHGHYELAQKDVQRALSICPHYGLALTFQGIMDLRSGNNAEAANAFQRAIDEDPSSGSAYLGLGIIFNHQGRFKEAIAPLDRAAPLLSSSWLLHFESAWAHLGLGESAAGLRDVTSAEGLAESDPDKLSGAAYLRGVARFQLRDYRGAHKYFEEAVQHNPEGAFAKLAKTRVKQIDDNVTEAR